MSISDHGTVASSVRRKYRLENNDRYAAAGAPAALMERLLRDIHLPHAAMNNRDFQPYTLVRIVLALILSLMATGASASIPPTYLSHSKSRRYAFTARIGGEAATRAALEG